MPAAMPPLVSLRSVDVVRGGHFLLRGIDWTIRPGEHWVVMGPNGCGKTSLLRVLTGYLMPTRGTVETLPERGLDREGWFDLRKRIGWVSASLAARIDPDQTALEVVLSGREGVINAWGKFSKTEIARAEEVLEQVRALPLRDRPWEQFSQGERQRVLMGRALMSDLKLLVLDEPCAGLDPVARERFLGFLETFARQPEAPGIVLVTHHVEEIVPAFGHVLLLADGRVIAAGPREEVLDEVTLEKAFRAPLRLRRTDSGRWRLDLEPGGGEDIFGR